MSDSSDHHPVTTLIEAARSGDRNAVSQLVPLLYEELWRLAREMPSKRAAGQTLQATTPGNGAK